MTKTILKLLKNNIVWYVSTRYVTYVLTFIVNMYVALFLGPEIYGVWSFFLLVFWYFNITDFGVPQSVQVLLVQNKNEKRRSADIEKTGLFLMFIISILCMVVAIIYFVFGSIEITQVHNFDWMFYAICICAFINFYNSLYEKIYRCKNRLFEIAYKQSSVVIFMAIAVLTSQKELLGALVISYLIWCITSLALFLFRGGSNFSGSFSKAIAYAILNKGIFLFFSFSGFMLIMMSTKTMISTYYSLEEFGLFSFAYYIGHAIYNCLLAFSTVTITKLIDRYHSPDNNVVLSTIAIVRDNYVSLFHGVIYFAMVFFPFVLTIVPQYSESLVCMNLCALMMLCYVNSFGYSTYLVAINKERKLSFIAISSFVLNIILGLFLVKVLYVPYELAIICTMCAYFYYTIMCTFWGRKELHLPVSFWTVIIDSFPVRLLIPFIVAVIVSFSKSQILVAIPFILFVLLNIKTIKSMVNTIRILLNNSKVVDI